jgi:hypothetical protein
MFERDFDVDGIRLTIDLRCPYEGAEEEKTHDRLTAKILRQLLPATIALSSYHSMKLVDHRDEHGMSEQMLVAGARRV